MPFEFKKTTLPDVILLQPKIFKDDRGYFAEIYQNNGFKENGIHCEFVQDNFSRSAKGALRGLHYQLQRPQAKLVMVTRGTVFDVAVDIRRDSPTFGQWVGQILSDENHFQLFIPAGFAHGFCVLSEEADFIYKCSDYYDPASERGILWSDKELNIHWPLESAPMLSAKDMTYPCLADVAEQELPLV
jgi:dTDP-4-dehydrorhamnose 3,5-epimerase